MEQTATKRFFYIFLAYLRLGCVSFGGPVAHLGYFREAFVQRRKWLTEAEYTELIALCHSVPGPSSSQLGFAIGWLRGGMAGGLAAWLGFTLPSALLMTGAAYGLLSLKGEAKALIGGLLTAAVAIVASAAFGLARKMCPDFSRGILALVAAALVYALPGNWVQLLVIGLGAGIGMLLYRGSEVGGGKGTKLSAAISSAYLWPSIILFALLLLLAVCWPLSSPGALYAKHFEAGALVFGGGHVVLPLLSDSVVANGLLAESDFLAGYSAAQAMPGPLFTLAAFNGTVGAPGWTGGIYALIAIFLPG
ncbi:MAG TPA: chromate efflux transporter, partial [Opitutales bacterium]|nr:chromate efflux transporter [Opitutales bacterium]